jgi:F-type H+-transporting ATPase subunit epsilon
MALHIEIVTPAKVAWTGEAVEVQAPGVSGEFGVLKDHTPMLAATRPGVVTLHGTASGDSRLVVGAGFAEVGPGSVTLLVDLCELAGDVDKAAAQADLTAAQTRVAEAEPGSTEYNSATTDAELAQARLDA